jgi:hypothetical protein
MNEIDDRIVHLRLLFRRTLLSLALFKSFVKVMVDGQANVTNQLQSQFSYLHPLLQNIHHLAPTARPTNKIPKEFRQNKILRNLDKQKPNIYIR